MIGWAILATLQASALVVVDAGHGGSDPGASGYGLLEKEINLETVLDLVDLLEADTADGTGGWAWDVHATRTSDVTVSLAARVEFANAIGADRFLSIHTNAFTDPAAQGIETYSYQEGTVAAQLRDQIHMEAVAHWPLVDRGVKTASFYVLKYTAMPAELHELGFVTSPVDSQYLGNSEELLEAASAHLHGLQSHYGAAPFDPQEDGGPGGGAETGILTGLIYDASIGPDARLPGSVVTLDDGSTVVANANGVYEVQLAAGQVTVSVVRHGFAAGTGQDTIVSGSTVWESLGLTPSGLPSIAFAFPTIPPGGTAWLLAGGPPWTQAWAVIGAQPAENPQPMPPWGDLLIDPSTPMTVALLGWIPSALGPLAVPIEIPLDSGLSGIQVAVQVFAGTLLGEATLLTIP